MKTMLTLLWTISFCFLKINKTSAQVNLNDSLALVDLYNSMDGSNWINHSGWLESPVSNWYGIYVSNNRVQQIDLDLNNLKGTLPNSLGNLSELIFFEMSDNQITGSLPSSLGNLSNLIGFSLSNNSLTGMLPSSFGNLTKLTTIFLWNNQLSGSLRVLENCVNPLDFELSYNQFTGELPNLQNIESMLLLNLDHNKLSGTIPESYNNFKGYQLTLNNNSLSGSIPKSFANFDRFLIFSIENNQFLFDSLEFILTHGQHDYFTYSPQAYIKITSSSYGIYGKLSVYAGGTLSNNTYKWYKNNALYKTIVGDSTFTPDTSGQYFVRVTNSIVTGLELFSDTITVDPIIVSIQKNISVFEGNSGTTPAKFKIALNKASTSDVFVNYTTKNLNATAGSDYTATSGTLRIKAGKVSGSVSVPVIGDNIKESNERFAFVISNPVNVTLGTTDSVICIIKNDDPSFTSATSTDEIKTTSIKVYPNPVKDVLTIEGLNANTKTTISIIDQQGKIIAVNSTTNSVFTQSIKQLTAGTYFVKIESGNKIETIKFIKQ